jgi:steroid 5-alpha reductase family enzyme
MLQINHCNTGYSIPAMEDRMVRTRGARYVSYQQSVSMIWPQCSRRNTDKRFVKPKSN